MFHGYWICLDAFLSFYSLVPLRSFLGIVTLLRAPITKRYPHAGTLFDLMRLAIFVSVSAVLFLLDTSMWYHFIRGQQTIKLFVVYNVLEVRAPCDGLQIRLVHSSSRIQPNDARCMI